MLEIKVIKTEGEYDTALRELSEIFQAQPGTPEGDRLDLLATLVESYEQKHYPIGPPDPIEAIKFRMDQMGWSVSDLESLLGLRARATEILERKRKLTLPVMRRLQEKMGISGDVLLRAY